MDVKFPGMTLIRKLWPASCSALVLALGVALLLGAGSACAEENGTQGSDTEGAELMEPIQGAFGFFLGERFAPNDDIPCRETRHGLVACEVEPPVPSPLFTTYFLDLDPDSRVIVQISATSFYNDRIAYERRRGEAAANVSVRFGNLREHQGGLLAQLGHTSAFLFGQENDTTKEYGLTLLVTDDTAYQAAVERLRNHSPDSGQNAQ
ncbi:MAG: hypothetical protein D6E12_02590 [Desulfovibrio sp.]|nr:MAG: hypothetical protein D6E12_02590 [Desulfovibrio sp.]